MVNLGLVITLYAVATLVITAIVLIWRKVERDWKWSVIFVLACIACFCMFWPLNIYQDMYKAKHPQAEEPTDTLKMLNELKRRANYEVND